MIQAAYLPVRLLRFRIIEFRVHLLKQTGKTVTMGGRLTYTDGEAARQAYLFRIAYAQYHHCGTETAEQGLGKQAHPVAHAVPEYDHDEDQQGRCCVPCGQIEVSLYELSIYI